MSQENVQVAEREGGFPVWPLLGLVCGACMVVLVFLGTRLTFFNDDWYFLLQRPGLTGDSILAPHNSHLVASLALSYKALVALFGFAQLPFRLVLSAAVAALGIVVYLIVSERAGRFLGLVAATIVIFLGPAWEDLLFYASLGLIGSLATGLGALLALEEDTPRKNAIACLLLVCALSLFGLGLVFLVAATIAVVLRRRPGQLWIPAVPAVLYGIWWLTYGSDAPSTLSWSNLEHLPRYMLDSASIGLASITGVFRGGDPLARGHVLLAIAVIAVAVWLLRGGRPSRWLAVFVGAALTFWALTGLSYVPGRTPLASRYQLVDATLLILIAAELFRPVRLRPWQTAAIVVLALFALVSNLDVLNNGYRFLRDQSAYAKAELGALEIARGHTRSDFKLTQAVALNDYLGGVTAERYFHETDLHGAVPHYSLAQIASAPPAHRRAADSVLATAYGMQPTKAERADAVKGCRRLPAGSSARDEVEIPPGGALLADLGTTPIAVYVRRFAPPGLPVRVGLLGPESTSRIAIPRDSAARPWRLTARGQSPLAVCTRVGRAP